MQKGGAWMSWSRLYSKMDFICLKRQFPVLSKRVNVCWFIVLLWMMVWAHNVSAAVKYELANKKQVQGDTVVGITTKGIRFSSGFNPGPQIAWDQLTTNSVFQIWTRLQRETAFIQKPSAERIAIAAAIRTRLYPGQTKTRPNAPVASAPQAGGQGVGALGKSVKGFKLPAAPPDKLPKRPSITPLPPNKWRGMPDNFFFFNDPKSMSSSLIKNPIVIFFCLLIFGANFHLSQQVADCRRRPRKLVCGLSFLAPFLVPLVFMLLPVPEGKSAPGAVRSRVAEASQLVEAEATVQEAIEESEHQEILEEPVSQPVYSNYYNRDQIKFNRNFFVTELMRFNRSVPIGEWLVVRTNNEREYWAGRIVKAEEETVTFSVVVGQIWSEQTIRYYQINEIFVQPAEG